MKNYAAFFLIPPQKSSGYYHVIVLQNMKQPQVSS